MEWIPLCLILSQTKKEKFWVRTPHFHPHSGHRRLPPIPPPRTPDAASAAQGVGSMEAGGTAAGTRGGGGAELRRQMAAQLAAYQRGMAVERERQASTSANYRAALLSSRSIALMAGKESKYQLTKETISSTAAINEKLEGMVTDQQNKRDHHAAVVSNHLEAVEALEAKFIEDGTRMKKIEEAVIWYSKFLGFQVVGGEVLQCDPSIKDSEELMKDLNLTNDLFKFVRIVRERFQAEAATVNGGLPMSSVVCPDASSIPVSPPMLMPLDSRTEKVPDKSLSQSKNKGRNLPSKRGAAALSAASPGSAGIRGELL
uniref:Kinetochore protein SPC25 n=1 Tax=Oryza meridionalis TaxID=40149 RepID=A0A0E0DL10_9ORYZ